MRKIVTIKDGRTFFFEVENEDIDCVVYETGKHMSGTEIANRLDITRSAVSQILKRSIKSIYFKLKNRYRNYSTTQIVGIMACVFNVKTDMEYKKFFRLFPEKIKGEINDEARKIGYC
jgi:predicted transcriptional regulator